MIAFEALILAPNAGVPLARSIPALLWPLLGRPLLGHVLAAAHDAGATRVSVVTGPETDDAAFAAVAAAHGATLVRASCAPVPRDEIDDGAPGLDLGFLHAALFAAQAETVLVLDGAAALVQPGTLRQLGEVHAHERAAATRLLAVTPRPDGRPACVCLFERRATLLALETCLRARPAGAESDLGDLFVALVESGRVVATTAVEQPAELAVASSAMGVATAAATLRERRNRELLEAGVLLEDPASTWVDVDARVAPGALLRPSVVLEGRTSVAPGAEIGPFARLVDVSVGVGALVLDHCVLRECVLDEGASVGPFAHVRPGSRVRRGARVGNFVELKQTDLGEGSKASHLSYLGDATIGSRVNLGAGTITCNYDGVDKHPTRIEDGAFIGSDTTLVAPLTVGAGAYVGAGSTLTQDIPADALALTRAPLVLRDGWAARKRAQRKP